LIIFDLLPTRFPEMFSPVFRRMVAEGMKPTAQAARLIIVTTTQAQDDVQAMYGIESSRIRLIPPACEPHRRFQGLGAEPVDLPQCPRILNIANASPHKGADVLLRAVARLKRHTKDLSFSLVICGCETDKFSSSFPGRIDHANALAIRDLVADLGLVEGRDVVFLGYVSNEQLRFLHERCSILVNAGQYDNGSFGMIEGAYFGQRVISTRYPAAEYLCERFGVPAKFFSPGDVSTLAGLLDQSLAEKRMVGAELKQVQATLASDEFGYRRFAERLYECLVELAELGRRERLLEKTPESIRPAA
jgi:glycosyltransferase involved in cell wall biosynthesis